MNLGISNDLKIQVFSDYNNNIDLNFKNRDNESYNMNNWHSNKKLIQLYEMINL